MKTCTNCKIDKPVTEYYFRKDTNTYRNACKMCVVSRTNKYYKDNIDKVKIQRKEYRESEQGKETRRKYTNSTRGKEIIKKNDKDRYIRHRDKRLREQKKYRNSEKGRLIHARKDAAYRAGLKTATPEWLTEEHKQWILWIYKQCKLLSSKDDIIYHVDHIHPLNGDNVCGLHVPWNLQILTEKENLSKGNKHEI